MYDDDGEVVGIATFGPPNAGIQGIDFGLPIEVVEPFMDDVGIENRSGPVDQAFDAGIEAYWRGDCETATAEMETVLERNPDHPWAGDYVDDCEAGRAPGQDS